MQGHYIKILVEKLAKDRRFDFIRVNQQEDAENEYMSVFESNIKDYITRLYGFKKSHESPDGKLSTFSNGSNTIEVEKNPEGCYIRIFSPDPILSDMLRYFIDDFPISKKEGYIEENIVMEENDQYFCD